MKQQSILIIEDDNEIRELLNQILSEAGYQVKSGTCVTDLYEIEKAPPDLLLLDNWLDGKTGHNICCHLKTAPKTTSIKVILTSATANLEQTAQSCRADSFLRKPFSIDDLLKTVGKFLPRNN